MKRSLIAVTALCAMLAAVTLGHVAFAATVVSPSLAISKDISGTVTLGASYQQVQPYDSNRLNCTIQNPYNATENLNVELGTMAQPYVLGPGQPFSTLNATVNAKDAIFVTATTTGHAFAGTCQ